MIFSESTHHLRRPQFSTAQHNRRQYVCKVVAVPCHGVLVIGPLCAELATDCGLRCVYSLGSFFTPFKINVRFIVGISENIH